MVPFEVKMKRCRAVVQGTQAATKGGTSTRGGHKKRHRSPDKIVTEDAAAARTPSLMSI
jgi:hypothetical protein